MCTQLQHIVYSDLFSSDKKLVAFILPYEAIFLAQQLQVLFITQ